MATLQLIIADWLVALGLIASLNLVVGKAGVWSIGHLSFYASGQLFLGVAVTSLHMRALPSVGLAMLGSALLALLVGATTLRLASDYFIIASIAVATLIQGLTISVLGPRGLSGVARILELATDWQYLACTLAPLATIVLLITHGYGNSALARVSTVVRKNEDIATSLGISAFGLRLSVFVGSSTVAATVGCFAATYYRMTDPAEGTLYRSILVFAIMLLGGVDSIKGTVVASILLAIVPRFIEYLLGNPELSYYAGKLSQLLFGLLVLLLVRNMPQGILGNRKWAE